MSGNLTILQRRGSDEKTSPFKRCSYSVSIMGIPIVLLFLYSPSILCLSSSSSDTIPSSISLHQNLHSEFSGYSLSFKPLILRLSSKISLMLSFCSFRSIVCYMTSQNTNKHVSMIARKLLGSVSGNGTQLNITNSAAMAFECTVTVGRRRRCKHQFCSRAMVIYKRT